MDLEMNTTRENSSIRGISHVNLEMNRKSNECSRSDGFQNKELRQIYKLLSVLLFFIVMVALIVLYILIGEKMKKHEAFRKMFSPAKRSILSSGETKLTSESAGLKNGDLELKTLAQSNDTGSTAMEITEAGRMTIDPESDMAESKTSIYFSQVKGQHYEDKEKKSADKNSMRKITKITLMIELIFDTMLICQLPEFNHTIQQIRYSWYKSSLSLIFQRSILLDFTQFIL